ncbi:hypothetical protein, partial [Streptomyces glaucescens]|uniref:hypothetical protein n=1 Tax=Streptomyces glaucescens TaxID=1907 RepID=UPI001B8044B6
MLDLRDHPPQKGAEILVERSHTVVAQEREASLSYDQFGTVSAWSDPETFVPTEPETDAALTAAPDAAARSGPDVLEHPAFRMPQHRPPAVRCRGGRSHHLGAGR